MHEVTPSCPCSLLLPRCKRLQAATSQAAQSPPPNRAPTAQWGGGAAREPWRHWLLRPRERPQGRSVRAYVLGSARGRGESSVPLGPAIWTSCMFVDVWVLGCPRILFAKTPSELACCWLEGRRRNLPSSRTVLGACTWAHASPALLAACVCMGPPPSASSCLSSSPHAQRAAPLACPRLLCPASCALFSLLASWPHSSFRDLHRF